MLLVSAWALSLRNQIWPLLLLLASIPVVRVLSRAHLMALGYSGQALADKMQYPIHLHCEPLLIGLVMALLSTTRPHWFDKQPTGRVAWRALGIMLVLAAAGIALDVYDKNTFAFLALGLIFGGLAYFGMVDQSVLTRPLHSRWFYPISRLSFGMYLNHFIVFPGSTAWVVRHGRGLPTPVVFTAGLLLGTGISIAVAIVSFLLIEQPFLQLRARLLATHQAVVPQPEMAV
jgi:peptidoglycan/LPS O-acetylase OafA/YrhL